MYKTARPIVPIVLCAAGALSWLFSERAYVTALTNDVYFSMFVCFVVVFAVGAMTLPSGMFYSIHLISASFLMSSENLASTFPFLP